MEEILSKVFDYLDEQDIKFNRPKKRKQFVCPLCQLKAKTAILLPRAHKITCSNYKCKANKNDGIVGDIVDLVQYFEKDKKNWTREKVFEYLAKKYNIEYNNKDQIDLLLDFYASNNFDLVPVSSNQKIPAEKKWTTKVHKDKQEWHNWLDDNLNIGIKTGKMSGITVIDIDQFPIPQEILELLGEETTLYQRTGKGCHYFFKYEPDLPKTRIVDLKIDIENDGGQVIVPPSTINGKHRQIELYEIQSMPKPLKEFLLQKTKNPRKLKPIPSARQEEELNLDNIDFQGAIKEGNRHHNFMKFGGILRKKMSLNDVSYTLSMMNKYLCDPPLSYREIQNIINSIDRYTTFDEKEISYKILDYINKVEDATARDVRDALGYNKKKVDELLSFLVKEGYIIKKRRYYKALQKMQWRDEFMEDAQPISYKMPYFNDIAHFREGDLVIIGAKTGVGKSHISVNIMKRVVEQGIKPKYVNLESANRFLSIARKMGLKEGDFDWGNNFSPETMELDDNAFTIIDWLCPTDYASTDKTYKYFAEQLGKHKGILVIFVQLKNNGEWFAPNMIEQFPAFAAKFGYEDEQGMKSSFQITKVREAKNQQRFSKIHTHYIWKTKELLTDKEYHERFDNPQQVTRQNLENFKTNSKDVDREDLF